ncbi:triphosphoribosyl-dephospho-CoA synthase [Adhaeretor mobilis]|uniref:ATP:dephospho-CoA triphosphoribosyl transferase n=1 Tax=Adhaeretor mobilis TaxID=1930276 RepID=A0A517MSF7_9BACT|nr:triphosphoribosyl-dephospho-CoA synthase [Adhaeretor mobilis]QDS97727.1 ATP:dephospho-CoA triphosphoribosyl transferase [Adhaeretor mobilis]
MADSKFEPPLTIGQCATLACIWEATAAKPGNVYRGADFEDLTYVDFLTSATVIGPALERAREQGVGATVLAGVQATRSAVGTNTNLGILLLLAPLAAQQPDERLADILASLSAEDTKRVYEAIRLAKPGGLGKVDAADVRAEPPAGLSLINSMQLAADRDLVAKQYTNGFADVHWLADRIETFENSGEPFSGAIVRGYLELLSREPDSLIARKCGLSVAQEVGSRAAAVLERQGQDKEAFEGAIADFDFYLRSDGHRLSPGTTADLVAAALFVLLRDGRIGFPLRYYPCDTIS